MLEVSDAAGVELKKVLDADRAKGKNLIVTFAGVGWSGPNLGLALEESTDGLDKLESNGVTAFIDPGLANFLKNYGEIYLDFLNEGPGRQGFTIRVGNTSCGDNKGGCSSCG